MKMRLGQAAQAIKAVGDLADREQQWITRVQTDSRCTEPGDLFVCLPGSRFDGHNFAAAAEERGAAAIVSQQPLLSGVKDVPVLLVPSTVTALGLLAASWRSRFQGTVVAVTASAGKTTVKELLGAALAEAGPTARNFKNWNNQIGLPLSMLACSGEEAHWVMEAGISRTGDMDELAQILTPDLVVIGNIGPAHLEGLGDEQGVAREKCKLLSSLTPGGRGVICRDYPHLVREAESLHKPLVLFSTQDDSACCFGRYRGAGSGGGKFLLRLAGEEAEVELPWRGGFMAENILAAACAARELGLDLAGILRGMVRATLPEHRFTCRSLGTWQLIDDSYNANPLSMQRSISCAAERSGDAPLVLVLGEMGELGEHAEKEHQDLGGFIARTGCRTVFFQGGHQDALRRGLDAGNWGGRFIPMADTSDLVRGLKETGLHRGTILVKGSRACNMERYVRELTRELGS